MATRFKNSCVYDLRYHTISELNHSFQRRRNCILQHGYATLLNLYTQHLKSKQANVFSENRSNFEFQMYRFLCRERVRDDFVSRVEQLIFASVGQPSLKSKQAANVFRHFKIFELQMYRFL